MTVIKKLSTNSYNLQIVPVSQQRINTNRRFVQDKQFRFVKESNDERNAPLLAAAQSLDETVARW